MKEKIIKFKGLIILIALCILNLGALVYYNTGMNDGVIIEEMPMEEQTIEKETMVEQVNMEGDIPIATTNGLEPSDVIDEQINELEANQEVPIYICGEVNKPGVYYVAQDAIINDVVQCAGGFTREAEQSAINLASPIQPNEKIIIPNQSDEIDKLADSYENRERVETLPSPISTYSNTSDRASETDIPKDSTASVSECININSATKEQLMSLNGIGEVKAEAIITYREQVGGFNTIDELMQISGIGEKTFEKLKQFITT